jgi:hypothetical protein
MKIRMKADRRWCIFFKDLDDRIFEGYWIAAGKEFVMDNKFA